MERAPELTEPSYVCPECHGELRAEPQSLRCSPCSLTFPAEDGVVDFTQGDHYDAYDPSCQLSEEQRLGLENELAGTRARIRDFFLPELGSLEPPPGRSLEVLDCGCGNGLSIDLLNEAGMEAWGVDSSRLRKWQWQERTFRHRLAAADGRKLPFAGERFSAVLCSGVLEHIGVRESREAGYTVEPLPGRDQDRIQFLGELLRVLRPGGVLWLDFPNGSFPLDFWHGSRTGGARFHWPSEGFLPRFQELRDYIRAIDRQAEVQAVSPYRRLQLRQVRRHWYGRMFYLPMTGLLRAMTIPCLSALARSALNPYLVVKVRRSPTE